MILEPNSRAPGCSVLVHHQQSVAQKLEENLSYAFQHPYFPHFHPFLSFLKHPYTKRKIDFCAWELFHGIWSYTGRTIVREEPRAGTWGARGLRGGARDKEDQLPCFRAHMSYPLELSGNREDLKRGDPSY